MIDGSKGAIPGAAVTVRNTATAVTRETVTDTQGLFVFTNLFAGTYDLQVTLTGFRTYEQKGTRVDRDRTRRGAAHRRSKSAASQEVVTVEASALRAQTQSGERSGTIRAEEIEGTQLRGRDFLGLLQGMPGVVDTNVRNAPGWNAFLGTQINGLSDQLMGMSYDGVSSKDTGFGAANYVTPSLDSIAEVKVQTSNYQAEYGRAGGANIIVVTKSGSSRFSGSAAYFKRHEDLTDEHLGAAAHLRRDRRHLAAVREAALPLRQLGVHAGRTGAVPGHDRSTRRATSCSSSTRWTCCRGPIRSW